MSTRVARTKGNVSRPGQPRAEESSLPDVQISLSPAGHETMAAIAEELLAPPPTQTVVDAYGDAPDVSFADGPVGRETLALIAEDARQLRAPQDTLDYGDRLSNAPGAKTPTGALEPQAFAIFEMLTFVVQGPNIAALSSDPVRRRFVAEHLLHRLPAQNMAQVERVDVTPWTVRGTVVVRVWCKL